MPSMPNNPYDPSQFQFLGAAQPAVPPWINPSPAVPMMPMGNDRAMPTAPIAGLTSADRGFMYGNDGYGSGMGDPSSGGPGMWGSFQQWMKDSGMLGSTDANGIKTDGWGGMALGGASALSNLYMGMQQYKLAKDQLAFGKEAFGKNFEAQRKSTNTALQDRQAARVASNSTGYQSVGDYMKQNGV